MLLAACFALGRQVIDNLPVSFPDVIFPGEREVVLGPMPYRDTVMPVVYSHESYPEKPSGTFGGPNWNEYTLGTVRWSVRHDNFGQIPCLVIHEEGLYMPKKTYQFNRFRKVTITQNVQGILEWWTDLDGNILRQFERVVDTRGLRTATCTYDKDSINAELDIFGKRSVATVYPADMSQLQLQFKPMIVHGVVTMPEKDYLVYEPFSGGFSKRKAKFGGHFEGSYLGLKFHGTHTDIDGIIPDGQMVVYIDDENDLVQVDMPGERSIKLGVTPPGKEKS